MISITDTGATYTLMVITIQEIGWMVSGLAGVSWWTNPVKCTKERGSIVSSWVNEKMIKKLVFRDLQAFHLTFDSKHE